MTRYNLEYNDDGTFTCTYEGMPWLEHQAPSAQEALEGIQDQVECELDRDTVTKVPGSDDFYE